MDIIIPKYPLDAFRGHQLLTRALAEQLPPLYSKEKENPFVHIKFFSPYSSWTWYILEGNYVNEWKDETSKIGWTFFGLVKGFESEFGYFTLDELATMGKNGIPLVERDCYFQPTRLSEFKD